MANSHFFKMDIRQKLKAAPRRFVSVETAIGTVKIQSLTELERTKMLVKSDGDLGKLHVLMIANCLVDDDNNRIFTDEPSDLNEICNYDASLTIGIVDAIQDHIATGSFDDAKKN